MTDSYQRLYVKRYGRTVLNVGVTNKGVSLHLALHSTCCGRVLGGREQNVWDF